eukprot:CAMPEP_0179109284 /NCGR_PEP_ID=MMETSP0796-20121207/50949_1 /TAXON_ID=73915 /ORGANISM="Pyrodinium bahamense, Strain pbaha01" /LENGTH=68 /DNA_ID=CAMNT_0020807387 /DNA_START=57 /DNA_END=260 /DNA_ORIENTATION=+
MEISRPVASTAVATTVQQSLEVLESGRGVQPGIPVLVRLDADILGPLDSCIALFAWNSRVALLQGQLS